MTWQDESVPLLRAVIFDMDSSNYTYSDSRLLEMLLTAAFFVSNDINVTDDYTISISDCDITPDPVSDPAFINLMVLKAGCMVDMGNARIAAMTSGIKANCGPAGIDTINRMPAFKILLENGYCKTYEKAVQDYLFNNASWIKGILSPFVNGSFDPAPYYNNERTRYGV